MRALLESVLASLRAPALRYADLRVTVTSEQHVRVRNGEVDTLASTVDRAAGVRVLVGNGWGFAATSDVSEESVRAAARRALEVAAASHIATTQTVVLSDIGAYVESWASTYAVDPWSIALEDGFLSVYDTTDWTVRASARLV